MATGEAMASDIATALARDLNCLAEENRNTRKRALQKISDAVLAASPPLAPVVLLELWEGALRVPLLRAFADPVEKNREMALTLVSGCAFCARACRPIRRGSARAPLSPLSPDRRRATRAAPGAARAQHHRAAA